MTLHKKESSYLKHNYCVDLVIFSPLGQKSNGLMTSPCVVSINISETVEDLFS